MLYLVEQLYIYIKGRSCSIACISFHIILTLLQLDKYYLLTLFVCFIWSISTNYLRDKSGSKGNSNIWLATGRNGFEENTRWGFQISFTSTHTQLANLFFQTVDFFLFFIMSSHFLGFLFFIFLNLVWLVPVVKNAWVWL